MTDTNIGVRKNDLADIGFVHGYLEFADSTQKEIDESTADWTTFTRTWDDLHPDTYMADGGRYRYRRYSEFDVEAPTGTFTRRPHVAYSQTTDVNHLNGGVERWYEPITNAMVQSGSFARIIATCSQFLESARPGHHWLAQCFQNRIVATPDESGRPAPEGRHRDGVDFVLTLFVARVGADGGESSTWTRDEQKLASVQLQDSGEYIFLDDNRLLHDVTPVLLRPAADTGYRDVLIVMFTSHGKA